MKKLYALLVLAFLSGPLLAQTQTDFDCDARPSPEALDYLRRSHQDRLNYAAENSQRARRIVKIAVHIIRTDAGGSGMNEDSIQYRIDLANVRYADANIVLDRCAPYTT